MLFKCLKIKRSQQFLEPDNSETCSKYHNQITIVSVLVEVPIIQPLQLPAPSNHQPFDSALLEQKLAQVRC